MADFVMHITTAVEVQCLVSVVSDVVWKENSKCEGQVVNIKECVNGKEAVACGLDVLNSFSLHIHTHTVLCYSYKTSYCTCLPLDYPFSFR